MLGLVFHKADLEERKTVDAILPEPPLALEAVKLPSPRLDAEARNSGEPQIEVLRRALALRFCFAAATAKRPG